MEYIENNTAHQSVTLNDVVRVLWRRKWFLLLIVAISLGATYVHTRRSPKVYRATGQLIVMSHAITPMSLADPNSAASQLAAESPETQVLMLNSSGMAIRTLLWLKNQELATGRLEPLSEMSPEQISDAVTVVAPRDTTILNVSAEAAGPERAERLANAVCAAFVEWKRDIARTNSQLTINNLELRASRAQNDYIAAQRKEKEFKQKYGQVDVSAHINASMQRYMTLENELEKEEMELAAAEAKLKSLGSQFQNANESIKNGTFLRDDGYVLKLQQELSQAQMDREQALQKFRPRPDGNPLFDFKPLDVKIEDLRKRIAETVGLIVKNKAPNLQTQSTLSGEYQFALTSILYQQAHRNAFQKQLAQKKPLMTGLPQTAMEYARLTNATSLALNLYTAAQTILNSVSFSKDATNANVQITYDATAPSAPYKPNMVRNLMIGTALGLFIALALTALVEQSDHRIRNMEDARSVIPGHIVGSLPRMSSRQVRNLIAGNASGQTLESFHMACANLSIALGVLAQETGRSPVLMVASALPQEGKSLIASQLALALARTGRRVTLIDADLRRPTQNYLFNSEEPFGLSDVLIGSKTLEEALVAGPEENLNILHSGEATGSPIKLFATRRMAQLFRDLKREADIIVMDTPACAPISDALFLASYADSILYVISAGKADPALVRDTISLFGRTRQKPMFFFINRVMSHGLKGYNKRYYRDGDTALVLEAEKEAETEALNAEAESFGNLPDRKEKE